MPRKSSTKKQSAGATQAPLDGTRTYTVGKMDFIVEPVFKGDATDTLGTVLLRLIQSDTETPETGQ